MTELAKVKHICYLAKNLENCVVKPATARDVLDQLIDSNEKIGKGYY